MSRPARLLIAVVAVIVLVGTGVFLVNTRDHHLGASSSPSTAASVGAPTRSAAPPRQPTAEDEGLTVATLFCRAGVTSEQWHAALAPHLTTAARALYVATAPANVPCTQPTGPSQPVGDQQTSTSAAWQYPARTGGPVTVTLTRPSTHAAWRAAYIQAGS